MARAPCGFANATASVQTPSASAEALHRRVSVVLRDVASTGWAVHARIAVDAPAAAVLERINPTVGVVETVDDRHSVLVTGGDSLEIVAVWIGMLGLPFHVDEPPELVEHVRQLAERYAGALPTDRT